MIVANAVKKGFGNVADDAFKAEIGVGDQPFDSVAGVHMGLLHPLVQHLACAADLGRDRQDR